MPRISSEAMNALGLEIGGSKLVLALGDEHGAIFARRRLAVDGTGGAAVIREQLAGTIGELLGGHSVDAVGVGFGGPVDWRSGKIQCSHQIEGWSDFELARWLDGQTDAPVFVDNDANVGALGEAQRGAGISFNPVFYVTLGSGVGGGLVVDGRIFHGAPPGEAEIGHVRLDRGGATVESRCSGWAVDARIRRLKLEAPASTLARLAKTDPGAEGRHLSAALAQKCPVAQQIVDEVTTDLAFGLSHVVHLFHPQVIVLGGGLSHVGEPLRAGVEKALRPFTMPAFGPGPAVRLAALGEDAVPVGALCLAGERLNQLP